jgi:hypothetical protein
MVIMTEAQSNVFQGVDLGRSDEGPQPPYGSPRQQSAPVLFRYPAPYLILFFSVLSETWASVATKYRYKNECLAASIANVESEKRQL